MKRWVCLFLSIALCFFTSCSLQTTDHAYDNSYGEVIEAGKHYRILKINGDKICYQIYNTVGDIVLSEITDRPLNIDVINENIIDIGIGMGTGLTIHKYYDIENDIISEEYLYVLANLNELVAYIDVPENNSFQERKVIVQNIFDESAFHKEYQLDFSNIDTPVIDASFSDDGLVLSVVYLSGEEQLQKSVTLSLN